MAVVELHGDDELRRRLVAQRILMPALRRFFDKATITVQSHARTATPVDTGRLRNSIATQVDPAPLPTWGTVGTNVHYGRYVHDGTRPHMPPVAALGPWARRHNTNPYLVARAIARRGTKGVPFLADAVDKSRVAVRQFLNQMANEIERDWSK